MGSQAVEPTPPVPPVDLTSLAGLPFTKMTGSGNDFVFFDGRLTPLARVTSPEVIRRICNRNNGIGADGLVVLEPAGDGAAVTIHYFNSDGSPADLCGNATLCSTALAAQWDMASPAGMRLTTGAGVISSRLTGHGPGQLPEIDLQPVMDVRPTVDIERAPGEQAVGFAMAGIPHLVVLCEDAEAVPLRERGPVLRHHPSLGAAGANVNWVSRQRDGRWRYRTFERGVEGETLACGTGAVATAVLLSAWGLAAGPAVTILTSSGRELQVRLPTAGGENAAAEGRGHPSLRGEGRVVFRGVIAAL
jgi:diaminopimelate epimerase